MCVVGDMVEGGGGEVVGVDVGVVKRGRLEDVGRGGEGREGWRGVSCVLSCPPVGRLWASVGLCWVSEEASRIHAMHCALIRTTHAHPYL